jgi:hypothetical protein
MFIFVNTALTGQQAYFQKMPELNFPSARVASPSRVSLHDSNHSERINLMELLQLTAARQRNHLLLNLLQKMKN